MVEERVAYDNELTIREAALQLGKSERWIRILIRRGILPARKEELGDIYMWRIHQVDLDLLKAQPASPRGRRGRTRYILCVPTTTENEQAIIAFAQTLKDATLQHGHKVLVDSERK